MRTFLVLLIVLITASGNEEVTINGLLEQNILLPCSCLRRSVTSVTWQKKIEKKKIFSYEGNTSHFSDGYKGRAKTFLAENNTNCSLLLSNITLADQGTYICIFYNPLYSYVYIDLKVSASYSVCQKPSPDEDLNDNLTVRVFQCNATGRFPDAQIRWLLDGHPLKKPSMRNTTYLNAGLYHLSSTIEFNGSSNPKCVVENPAVSTHLSYSCSLTDQQIQTSRLSVITSSVIITIVLLLIFSLVLYCFQTSKRRMEEGKAAVTNSELMELNMSEHSKCKNLFLVTTEQ